MEDETMVTTLKKGFIPAGPLVSPPQHIVDYKSSEDFETGLFSTAIQAGNMVLMQFARSADINRANAIMRFLDRRFYQLHFTADMVDRLGLALGEMIPNAFQHALPNSRVGVTILIYGQAPHRTLTTIVHNYMVSSERLKPPSQTEVKEFEALLYETRGRGIAIVRQLASDVHLAWSEGFDVTTVAHFKEE